LGSSPMSDAAVAAAAADSSCDKTGICSSPREDASLRLRNEFDIVRVNRSGLKEASLSANSDAGRTFDRLRLNDGRSFSVSGSSRSIGSVESGVWGTSKSTGALIVCRNEGRGLLDGGVARRREEDESLARSSALRRNTPGKPDIDECARRSSRDLRLGAADDVADGLSGGGIIDDREPCRRFIMRELRRRQGVGRLTVSSAGSS
jgi:hypothetical protein